MMELLGEELDELSLSVEPAPSTPEKLAELERKYLNASPEVKQRVSRSIERGSIGRFVKQANGFRCQLCEALGQNPICFLKTNGEPYVEAHHVMPVSSLEIGSLAASNVMTLCPNHHREVHYGQVTISIGEAEFQVSIDGRVVSVPRVAPTANAA